MAGQVFAPGSREDRMAASLLGLALGDALGVPVEFEPRSERDARPVAGMAGGGTWSQEPGTWSDDSSLALCLAESILRAGYDPGDFGARALRWLDSGYLTARGEVFDVGGATRRALVRVRSGMPAVLAGGRGENDNGNGSLMRALPASLAFASSPEPLRFRAVAAYSAVTHGHPRSLLAAWLHCLVCGRLLAGLPPPQAYAAAMEEARSLLPSLPVSVAAEAGAYERVLDGSLARARREDIRGSGYVVHNLEAALWCLVTTRDFPSCALAAVNLGEDTDTTGATAGGLAGLAWGSGSLPPAWLAVLARRDDIEALASSLAIRLCRPAPLPRSYWVIPGSLLAGGNPMAHEDGGTSLRALLEAGVDAFVDLTEEGEVHKGRIVPGYEGAIGPGRERRSRPIRDMGAAADAVRLAMRDIDELCAAGRTVYVHCLGGLGRTGTVVGAWLAERGLARPAEVEGLLASLRAGTDKPGASSPETEDQRRILAAARPGPLALPL